MFYTVYHGFHGQIFATNLALFIFFLNLQTIQHCKKFSDYYSYIHGLSLPIGAQLDLPHMLPFIYVLLTAYLLWVSFLNKSASLALQWISFVIISFAITFALSPTGGRIWSHNFSGRKSGRRLAYPYVPHVEYLRPCKRTPVF